MGVSDAMHSGDIVKRLERLERKQQEMGSARRMENASVGNGGIRLTGSSLTVTDDLGGQVVVQLGILDDGTQGLQIVDPDTGAPVDLHTIAFGLRSDRADRSGELTRGTDPGQLEWRDLPGNSGVGPSVTVRVGRTGRMRVSIAARMGCRSSGDPNTCSAAMGFEIDGPEQFSAFYWGYLELIAHDSANVVATLGRPYEVSGLEPGLYTVTAKYAAGYASVARFTNRYIDVQPY